MQLSRRELLMLDGARRSAQSRVPRIAYGVGVPLAVLALVSIGLGVYESVTTPGQSGDWLVMTGANAVLMAAWTISLVYLISTYSALVRKLQDRIDELEGRKPPASPD